MSELSEGISLYFKPNAQTHQLLDGLKTGEKYHPGWINFGALLLQVYYEVLSFYETSKYVAFKKKQCNEKCQPVESIDFLQ